MDILLPPFRDRLLQLIPDIQGTTIFSAFSGGKDSVTLLILLSALENELNFRLKAAYLNHGIREDASSEARWVSDFCLERSIPLTSDSAGTGELSGRKGINLEAAASHMRYAFFSRLINLSPTNWLATGHTLSDQVETFFMRLMRGSGGAGLAGILPVREKRILRPLAIFSEADILAFLKRRRLRHYEDPSNRDLALLRNRLRHQILPMLRNQFPHMDQRILDTTRIFRDEADWFVAHAQRILNRISLLGKILPPGALDSLHPAVQRHVLREYLRRLRGDLLEISLSHIEALMPSNPSRRHLSLPGITLTRQKQFLFPRNFSVPAYSHVLFTDGVCLIPEISARVHVSTCRTETADDGNADISPYFRVTINPEKLRFPLRVRPARSTDRYRKQGSEFSQQVFEMLRAAGLPAALRPLRPLLCDASDIPFWLPGNAPAVHAAPRSHTRLLKIHVEGIWPLASFQSPDA